MTATSFSTANPTSILTSGSTVPGSNSGTPTSASQAPLSNNGTQLEQVLRERFAPSRKPIEFTIHAATLPAAQPLKSGSSHS